MDGELSCNCEQALRLADELKWERRGTLALEAIIRGVGKAALNEHERLMRRRLEVVELKLRARSLELRYQHVSAIPEFAAIQKERRDRNRERLIAVMALRSFAR